MLSEFLIRQRPTYLSDSAFFSDWQTAVGYVVRVPCQIRSSLWTCDPTAFSDKALFSDSYPELFEFLIRQGLLVRLRFPTSHSFPTYSPKSDIGVRAPCPVSSFFPTHRPTMHSDKVFLDQSRICCQSSVSDKIFRYAVRVSGQSRSSNPINYPTTLSEIILFRLVNQSRMWCLPSSASDKIFRHAPRESDSVF